VDCFSAGEEYLPAFSFLRSYRETYMNRSATVFLSLRSVFKSTMFGLLCLLGAVFLNACGGSSSSNNMADTSTCTGSCGSAMVSLTDAQGDFLTYSVDVLSLKLTRADGTVVETLPNTTRVDFATLVSLSEIVSNGQVPAGSYSSASITLDYSNANIVVDDGTANGLQVTAVDSSGAALAQTTLTVQLDAGNKLIVNPGKIASLNIDFNLLASNTVNNSNATVTVNPVLVASLVPPTTKPLRIRGAFVSADTSASTYTVTVRPFHDSDDSSGQQVVHVTDTTTFSIDGMNYTGSAGLSQLATLSSGTLVVAYGTVSKTDNIFTASNVLAGSSVVSNTLDSVEGDVIARSGNTITLRGATLCGAGDRDTQFRRGDVTVTVGSGTIVTEDGHSGSYTIADISVGQHVQFFGVSSLHVSSSSSSSTSSSDSTSSSSSSASSSSTSSESSSMGDASIQPITFDATAGSARLMLTSLWGTVTAVSSNNVTLNLQALDGRSPSAFNFAGTGASSASDAAASAYVVGTSGLSLTGVAANTAVRFVGFIAPFGSVATNGVDFNAQTLVNYAATNALLFVSWGNAGISTPFGAMSSSTLSITQAVLDSSVKSVVKIGPQTINLMSSASHAGGVMLVPADATADNVQYAISHRTSHTIGSYSTFADFETALANAVSVSGTTTLGLAAEGVYDQSTSTLTAAEVIVMLSD
jgi:hypothetical protein